eukprot:Gb_38224 [translate_table: standard]
MDPATLYTLKSKDIARKKSQTLRLIERRPGCSSCSHNMRVEVSVDSSQNLPQTSLVNSIPQLESVNESAKNVQHPPEEDETFAQQYMTDMEVEEVKGFMELGFSFTQDELSPRVMTLLPGLRRLTCTRQEKINTLTNKPHVSEGSMFQMSTSPEFSLPPGWKIPAPNHKGLDMKERLKLWARYVAFSVKC